MESLSGKFAVVTGGTRGIGRAISERLLREGVAVAFCGRSADTTARAAAEMQPLGRVFGRAADVSDMRQVREFFAAVESEFGALDILINNAGQGSFGKTADLTPEQWHRNIDLNLNGPFYCSHEALALFRKRGAGFIVNISSLAGRNAFATGAGYNASKFGLNGFTEALMLDHRNDNVRVSSIMPGSVDTGDFGGPFDRAGDTSWMMAPEDVAEAVAMVLKMPARTMVSRLEMRPSRPKK
ncbi:MAG TPA: SDR family oxidoreductase [Bryobacteraceae bacterium]|nr:SDR family oxidoreductase [Bryobacteraceae bacterium]